MDARRAWLIALVAVVGAMLLGLFVGIVAMLACEPDLALRVAIGGMFAGIGVGVAFDGPWQPSLLLGGIFAVIGVGAFALVAICGLPMWAFWCALGAFAITLYVLAAVTFRGSFDDDY